MSKVSTSALAKKMNIESKELFNILESKGYITKGKDKKWYLTSEGKERQGEYKKSLKYGTYITWPENLNIQDIENINKSISVTAIAEKFSITARRMNQILSELGWIEKDIKGWKITNFGEKIGGEQLQHYMSGTSYTHWPEDILLNKSLIKAVDDFNPQSEKNNKPHKTNELDADEFRKKFPAQYRAKDGHNVRSRGELLIDNELYSYSLAHAYERKIPIEEDVYSDFYIPAQNGGEAVYIEYWGIEDQKEYEERKNIKKKIYQKYDLNLIELENKHLDNLDDHLPRMLLKYKINVS